MIRSTSNPLLNLLNIKYNKGVSDGIELAVKSMLASNTILFDDKAGYGTCNKIAVDVNDDNQITEIASRLQDGTL